MAKYFTQQNKGVSQPIHPSSGLWPKGYVNQRRQQALSGSALNWFAICRWSFMAPTSLLECVRQCLVV
jgi:hypothetical protein